MELNGSGFIFKTENVKNDSKFNMSKHTDVDIAYILSYIVNTYRNILISKLDNIIEFKNHYTNSTVAVAERKMKVPKSLLSQPKPAILINTSIDREYETHFFSAYNHLTNLAHSVDIGHYTDCFVRDYDVNRRESNMQLRFSFKTMKINLELSILDDSRPKLLNTLNAWESEDYPMVYKEFESLVKFPIPKSMLIRYASLYDLDIENVYEIYKHMKSRSLLTIKLIKNTQKGHDEIFFVYSTKIGYQYEWSNITDGMRKNQYLGDFLLTRSVYLILNIPSIGFIDADRRLYQWRDIKLNIDDRYELTLKESADREIPYNIQTLRDLGYSEYITSDISGLSNGEKLDCTKLMVDKDIKGFYAHIKDNGMLVEDYIRLAVFIDKKIEPEGGDFIIDEDNMSVTFNNVFQNKRYRVGLYVKLNYYNEWIERFENKMV